MMKPTTIKNESVANDLELNITLQIRINLYSQLKTSNVPNTHDNTGFYKAPLTLQFISATK